MISSSGSGPAMILFPFWFGVHFIYYVLFQVYFICFEIVHIWCINIYVIKARNSILVHNHVPCRDIIRSDCVAFPWNHWRSHCLGRNQLLSIIWLVVLSRRQVFYIRNVFVISITILCKLFRFIKTAISSMFICILY